MEGVRGLKLFKDIQTRPWWITAGAVVGLLAAIIVAGLIGFWQTRNIERVADRSFDYVELEDEGDDIRAAVLDMRHFHRNLYFSSLLAGQLPREQIDDYEQAYAQLQEEIDELEEVGAYKPSAPQPEDFRRWSEDYHADFEPFLRTTIEDPEAFDEASDRGLRQIGEMETAAEELDGLGEELTDGALQLVDRAATTSALVLLGAIAGLVLAGAVLALAAVRVVSELRRLYAEQQEAARKLAEASRAKTDFIADVSHELRTPLTVLRGNAEVGLALETENCDHNDILEEIVKESTLMSRMVEDLLLLARSDAASLPLECETVSVAPFLAELAGRAEVLTRERGAVLETDFGDEGSIEVDPGRIEQAVMILVDNAAKYGSAGGRITLSSEIARSGELRIVVEDRGPGIPKEDLPHVFERFYRVDKTRTRKAGGTGLGLPIAKTIVQAHGGRIEAASRQGAGTRMSIYLPLLPIQKDSLQEHRKVPENSR